MPRTTFAHHGKLYAEQVSDELVKKIDFLLPVTIKRSVRSLLPKMMPAQWHSAPSAPRYIRECEQMSIEPYHPPRDTYDDTYDNQIIRLVPGERGNIWRKEIYPMRFPNGMDPISLEEIAYELSAELSYGLSAHVDVRILYCYWEGDPSATRERVVINLSRKHVWNALKLVIGLDYLGDSWANLSVFKLLEPDPQPLPLFDSAPEQSPKPELSVFSEPDPTPPIVARLILFGFVAIVSLVLFLFLLYTATTMTVLWVVWFFQIATLLLWLKTFWTYKQYSEAQKAYAQTRERFERGEVKKCDDWKENEKKKVEQYRQKINRQIQEQEARHRRLRENTHTFHAQEVALFDRFMTEVIGEVIQKLFVRRHVEMLAPVIQEREPLQLTGETDGSEQQVTGGFFGN